MDLDVNQTGDVLSDDQDKVTGNVQSTESDSVPKVVSDTQGIDSASKKDGDDIIEKEDSPKENPLIEGQSGVQAEVEDSTFDDDHDDEEEVEDVMDLDDNPKGNVQVTETASDNVVVVGDSKETEKDNGGGGDMASKNPPVEKETSPKEKQPTITTEPDSPTDTTTTKVTTLEEDDDAEEEDVMELELDDQTGNMVSDTQGKANVQTTKSSDDDNNVVNGSKETEEAGDAASKKDGKEGDDPAENDESQKEKPSTEGAEEEEDEDDANMPMITVRKVGLFADDEDEDEQMDQAMDDLQSMMQVEMMGADDSSASSRPRRRAATAAANVIREISQEESKELDGRRKSRDKAHDQSMVVVQSGSGERNRCHVCKKISVCKITVQQFGQDIHLCSTVCFNTFRNPDPTRRSLPCAKCGIIQRDNTFSTYYWETMNFCSDLCIGNFQMEIGSKCATCMKKVAWQSLGKYCVRFGSDVRQFCSASCLESYKKNARVCFHCQLDIKKLTNVILANIPTKATPKEFCSQDCVEMYIEQNLHQTVRTKPNQNSSCNICSLVRPTFRELVLSSTTLKVCCEICWSKLVDVKHIRSPTKCEICTKYINLELGVIKPAFYVSTQKKVHGFCSATCKNVFVLRNRQILACTTCKVKKYNYDLIQHVNEAETLTFAVCSLNCIPKPSQYIINLRDTLTPASTASEMFTKSRLLQEKQLAGSGTLSRIRTTIMSTDGDKTVETDDGALKISSVSSLARRGGDEQGPYRFDVATGDDVIEICENDSEADSVELTEEEMDALLDSSEGFLVFPMNEPVEKRNKSCLVRPFTTTVGIQVEPEELGEKVKEKYVPIFIPYYVPFPFYGFDSPTPIPLPVPLPVPIPIPILVPAATPTPSSTSSSSESASKSSIPQQNVNDMSCNIPLTMDQPLQQQQQTGQSSLRGSAEVESSVEIPENMRLDSVEFLDLTGPNVGETDNFDYLSTIPSLDMELNLGGVSSSHGLHTGHSLMNPGMGMMSTASMGTGTDNMSIMQGVVNAMENPNFNTLQQHQQWQQPHVMPSNIPIAPIPPKLTREGYALRAWKHYFGHDSDPWMYSGEVLAAKLVEWVEKGQKPNSDRYKPSFLLYLCLGIQEYLRHNQKTDKIFYDPVYEPFIGAFTNYANYTHQMKGIVESPIEDYHLWESSELGVSSPQVLIFTLIYLNYKYFHLQTWQEHAALQFEQVGVMERMNPQGRKVKYMVIQGQKYDVPEQHLNPTKCPIKLFEFYKHKCVSPTGNFYKAIIPHCPKAAWFSADALDEISIFNMLMRATLIKVHM